MGTITRSFANNITTSGVLLPASLTNNSIANVTAYNAAVATGNMVLISSQTASASASISFTTGIDSTYKEYQFYFINVRPATTDVAFQFNMSTDSGSNYNVTKTSSHFQTFHDELDSTGTSLGYDTGRDIAQGTGFETLGGEIKNDSDSNVGGTFILFNPASTTYVKHYMSNINITYNYSGYPDNTNQHIKAGYANTTSAVNAIQFKMSSGNMDGTILMYGIV